MKKVGFVTENRTVIIAIIVLVAGVVAFYTWASWIGAVPLDEPISLTPAGKVDKDIYVPLPENYELVFVFDRTNESFDELRRLVGDIDFIKEESKSIGAVIPIRWALSTQGSKQIVASGEVNSTGSSAWADSFVERKIGNVKVEPGRYRIHAEILREIPELASLRTKIAIQLNPKFTTTWQMAVSWWGSIVVFMLIAPITVVLALVLISRGAKRLR